MCDTHTAGWLLLFPTMAVEHRQVGVLCSAIQDQTVRQDAGCEEFLLVGWLQARRF